MATLRSILLYLFTLFCSCGSAQITAFVPSPKLTVNSTGRAAVYHNASSRHTAKNAEIPPSEAGADTHACRGEQVQIGTAPNATYVYKWSPVTGLSNPDIANPFVAGVNDDTTTLYKKYYVTTSLAADALSSSIDSITVAINPKPIINKDTIICKGSAVILKANSALSYQWTPSTGLINANDQNAQASPTNSQTYYLAATYLANNLVSNGDFQQGTVGVNSSYVYCNVGNCLIPHSSNGYSVGTNAKFFQSNFTGHDHTTGNGNFMIVNGAVPNLTVWKQTVTVTPNTTYGFRCWVSSLVKFNFAQIRFSINGVPLISSYNAPADTSIWSPYFTSWNSGLNSTATIEIVDVLNQSDGNDFGLDDIFLGPISSCTDSVRVQVYSTALKTFSATICSGKSDTLPSGKIVSVAGTYLDTVRSAAGCDSIINTVNVTVISAVLENVSATVCSGQPYVLPSGKPVYNAGIYNDTLRFKSGCDSVIATVTLNVFTATVIDTSVSICTGQFYTLPSGNKASSAGTYSDTAKNHNGCDSLISTIHLTVISPVAVSKIAFVCKGQSYIMPSGISVNTTGVYKDTLKSRQGCDSLITTVNLTVMYPSLATKAVSICNGQAYILSSGLAVTTAGTYYDTIKNILGCDSLVTTINLAVFVSTSVNRSVFICPGQNYTLPSGVVVNKTGIYSDTLKNIMGCDSLITITDLTVIVAVNVTKDVSICKGQSYTMPAGMIVNTAGIYKDTLKNVMGCDSLITTVNLVVVFPVSVIVDVSICNGQVYSLPSGTQVAAAGTYQDTVKSRQGCDSLISTVHLNVFNPAFITISASICLGQIYTTPSGKLLNSSGTFNDTLKSNAGCDSLITTINLLVVSPALVTKTVLICDKQSYTMPSGLVINTTGIYKDTLKNMAGCDSLVTTINLIVSTFSASNSIVSICPGQSYTLPSGVVVNTAGVYQSVLTNVNGCDSVITTTITITPPLSVTLSAPLSICSGSAASILANVSGGNGGPYSYSWSGSVTNENPLVISPVSDTKVIVTASDGCTAPAKDSVNIVVKPKPTPAFVLTWSGTCIPLTVQFQNSTSPAANNTYKWNFGDQTNSTDVSPSHVYSSPGAFDVSLVATNSVGCADSLKTVGAVVGSTPPVAAFTTRPSPNVFANSRIDFVNLSTGASSWFWLFGDGVGSSVEHDPTYIYPDSGTYRSMLIVTNGDHCADTAYSNIEVKGGDQIYIPSAFTPNGDNVNDNFRIYGIGLRSVEMNVFNSWGEKVFQQKNSLPVWDGKDQRNGTDSPQGVFVYVVKVIDKAGMARSFKGVVTLLR